MKGLYAAYKTDSEIEKNGIVLEFGKNSKDEMISIRIARAGGANTKFSSVFEQLMKPYRRQVQNGTLDDEVAKDIMRKSYAEAVILSWENVEDENGEPLSFTKENVIKVLTDLPDWFADIQEQSQRMALFRAEIRENDAKN